MLYWPMTLGNCGGVEFILHVGRMLIIDSQTVDCGRQAKMTEESHFQARVESLPLDCGGDL